MVSHASANSGARERPRSLARTSAMPFCTETFANPSDIEHIWRPFESTAIATNFQRYDWVEAYVRNVLPHENARTAIVLGRLDGKPAFILPFAIARRGPVRVAGWIGGNHSSYNFGLWSPEAVAAMAGLKRAGIERMLGSALADADCAVLERTPKFHNGAAQPLAALASSPSPTEGYSFELIGGFDAVLKRTDGAARRRRVRTKERRMAEIGPIRYGVVHDPAQARAALDFFFEQKELRLAEQGKPNSFTGPVKSFFHDLLERSRGMAEPLLEMTELSVGDRLRAVRGAGIHHGRLNGYFMTFARDDVVAHSPGSVLLFRHIEECCERGLAAYDLGVGYEDYKTHWCDIIHELDDTYAAFTPLGSAAIAAIRAGQGVKARLRRHKALWQRLKTAQAYLSRHGKPT